MKKILKIIGIGIGLIILGHVVNWSMKVYEYKKSQNSMCLSGCDGFRIPIFGKCIGEELYIDGCVLPEPYLSSFNGYCSDDGLTGRTKILKKNFISEDTMKIRVQTEVTCCVDFEGDIEVNKNIINLKYIETGEPCYCLCRGIFDYEVQGVDEKKYNFQLNGKEIN